MDEDFKKRLKRAVGAESIETNRTQLLPYRKQVGSLPGAVVRVRDGGQASKVVMLANRFGIPFAAADSGGILSGIGVALSGGFILDFTSMNRIKAVRTADFCSVVEPAASLEYLNKALKAYHFFFPPDPLDGDAVSLGRMVIGNTPFPRGRKYGTVRDYVLGVEAVTPTGELVRLGTATLKNSSGLQIERFLAGSGGLIGFPTEITLLVRPRPEKCLLAVSMFDSLKGVAEAVYEISGSLVVPSTLEVIDKAWVDGSAVLKKFAQAEALLFMEFEGHAKAVKRESDAAARICRRNGATSVRRISRKEKIEKLREARRVSTGAASPVRSVVPLSRTVDILAGLRAVGERHRPTVLTYGYCLEQDFHTEIAIESAEQGNARRLISDIHELVDSLGGSVSGPGRACRRRRSLDEISLAIKKTLDPNSVVNPARSS